MNLVQLYKKEVSIERILNRLEKLYDINPKGFGVAVFPALNPYELKALSNYLNGNNDIRFDMEDFHCRYRAVQYVSIITDDKNTIVTFYGKGAIREANEPYNTISNTHTMEQCI